jgi:predicted TIM-barrel fold metal-dependent hydrolase
MSPRDRAIASASQMFCGCGIMPRRRFLAGAGALAAGFLLPDADLEAQTPSGPRKVDVHSHYAPPQWAAAIPAKINQGAKMNSPLNSFKDWTPAVSIEVMDQAGVATSMLSITTPGIWYGEKYSPIDETRRLARDCNEYGARMRSDYKGRFGQFAVLPLPDVDGSLREIEYALDTLKADGCGMLTNYGEIYGDRLLGDPSLAPVFEELNRRKALVYVHRRIYSGPYEIFGWDHYRTILSLIKAPGRRETGVPTLRYPDIRFIISHSGGLMPFTFERSNTPQGAETKEEVATRNAMLAVLRQFHYDTAHSNNAFTLSALKKLIPVSQIMFGTDYPLTKVAEELKGLETSGVMNADELRLIARENALGLVPRYKT